MIDQTGQTFRDYFEYAPEAIVLTDPLGMVTAMNRLARRLMGSIDSTPGRAFYDHFVPDCRQTIVDMAQQARAGEPAADRDVVLQGGGSDAARILLNADALAADTGEIAGIRWILRSRPLAQPGNDDPGIEMFRFLADVGKELSSSLDYDETLQRVVGVAVPFLADWCAVDLLDTGEQYLRRVAVRSRDDSLSDQVREARRRYPVSESSSHPVVDVVRSGKPVLIPEFTDDVLRRMTRDGLHFDIIKSLGVTSSMIVPLMARGSVIGAITFAASDSGRRYDGAHLKVANDLAARVAQAIDNARLFQQAEEVSRIREHYLSVASHELRTPLAVVVGFANLLLRQLESETPDRVRIELLAEELRHGIERLEALTEDLLVASSFQQQGEPIVFESMDLVELAVNVMQRFDIATAVGEEHRFTLESPEALIGDWNSELLDRALSNLISNAVKYSPDGGDILITIENRGDTHVLVSVADSGIGISEEDQDRLFRPFSRGASARKITDGTGLGLYITRQIVEQHRGVIALESASGEGTTFSILLPRYGEGQT